MSKIEKPEAITTILNRRSFLQRAGLGAAALVPGASLIMASGNARAQSAQYDETLDIEILNFALNLEYLEANYYSLATTGMTLAQRGVPVSGKGTAGTVITGANGSTAAITPVPFTSGSVEQQYAMEIAADELAHVEFLRSALGSNAVAQPPINLFDSFNTLATAANNLATTQGMTPAVPSPFDPYSSVEGFFLGGFVFEDVGVTAYNGAAPLITNKTYLAAAASILGVEAYHASEIRTVLYGMSTTTPSIINIVQQISNLRASLSGAADDQGITMTVNGVTSANIVPTNANALVFARDGRQVDNIIFGARNATHGLFFPDGYNEVYTSAT